MGLLQTAWQTFIDRVLGDDGIQEYFDTVRLTERTGTFEGNWLEIQLGALVSQPKAVPTLKNVIFPVEFKIITDNSEPQVIEKQALKALETFLNGVEKEQSDATWQASFLKTDWEVEPFVRLDQDSIEITGLITLITQPYTMGAL